MNMKIALILSGQLRKFEFDGINSIAKMWGDYCKNNNIDIFFCIDMNNFYSYYDDKQYFIKDLGILSNCIQESIRLYKNYNLIDIDEAKNKITNILQKYFGNNLNLLFINNLDINHDQNDNNINSFLNYQDDLNLHNRHILILNQYYLLKEGFQLLTEYEKNNNITYDSIIRSRFDTFIPNLVDNQMNLNIDNQVYCSYAGLGVIHDYWFYGNREIMDKICNYYDIISQNIIDKKYFCIYYNNNDIIGTNLDQDNILKVGDYYNNTIITRIEDLTRAPEFGYTCMLKKLNYNFISLDYFCDKFYN